MRFEVAAMLLALTATFAWAGGDVKEGKKDRRMCPVQMTVEVPCDEIPKKITGEKKTEKIVEKTDEVCVRRCLSDEAWRRCETKSWFANMKGHPHAKPNGDAATQYSTARFFEQCGIDCRKRGTMRIGYQSPYTREWTVFKYGHPED